MYLDPNLWLIWIRTQEKSPVRLRTKDPDPKHCFWGLENWPFQGLYCKLTRAGNLLIHLFAHFAQIKWANVSDSLRLLKKNERPWANCSGRSWQISDHEQFAQVDYDKWENEQFAQKILAKKYKILIFSMFYIGFSFLKMRDSSFPHFWLAMWANC